MRPACLPALLLALPLASCAAKRPAATAPAPARPPAARVATKPPADHAAQKLAYDRGLRFYGEDKYLEARGSWEEAVRHGPDTELGRQAQSHLRRVDRMIRRLKELDAP